MNGCIWLSERTPLANLDSSGGGSSLSVSTFHATGGSLLSATFDGTKQHTTHQPTKRSSCPCDFLRNEKCWLMLYCWLRPSVGTREAVVKARSRPSLTPASSFIRSFDDKKLVVLCLDGRVVAGMSTETEPRDVGVRPEPSHGFILNYLAA